jgi:hypothetical protein
MKSTLILILGFFALVTSCSTPKTVLSDKDTQVMVNISLPDEVEPQINLGDTNLYNTYYVNYKDGKTQTLQYEYRYNIFRVVDSVKVDHIDTLQFKVLWKDLN